MRNLISASLLRQCVWRHLIIVSAIKTACIRWCCEKSLHYNSYTNTFTPYEYEPLFNYTNMHLKLNHSNHKSTSLTTITIIHSYTTMVSFY